MEREWRVVGNVLFELSDVARIFLRRGYEDRFADDLPSYEGPVCVLD